MSELSDFDLIKSVVEQKSQQHFSILVQRHSENLYWSVRNFVGNHELANDIVQNAWIKAWKGLSNFKFESAFYSWLYRIARNEAITSVKKEAKTRTLELNEAIVGFESSSSHHHITGEQISQWLIDALDTLPEKQRITFELKYFQEKKYKEIAEILSITEGGAKASYFHAAKKIEDFLKNQLNHL